MLGDEQADTSQGQGADVHLEHEVEREGAVWMAQPPPAPRAFPQWVVHTDSVIMNVLARCVPCSFALPMNTQVFVCRRHESQVLSHRSIAKGAGNYCRDGAVMPFE